MPLEVAYTIKVGVILILAVIIFSVVVFTVVPLVLDRLARLSRSITGVRR